MRPNTVTMVVHDILTNNRGMAKEIAKKLGKPYPTLMRELNPWDRGAKLGADTLLEIMAITGNYRPLEFMAENLGVAPSSGHDNGALN